MSDVSSPADVGEADDTAVEGESEDAVEGETDDATMAVDMSALADDGDGADGGHEEDPDAAAGHGDVGPDQLVTVEDLGGEPVDVGAEDLSVAPDLRDEFGDEALLFDGDPDEFELDFGPGPYPAPRPEAGDMIILDEPGPMSGPPPRRMGRMERRRRVRLQARRVRRIVRHVEPWSVLKISIFFYACLWVIFLVAGFIVWGVAESSGTVEKIEDLITDLFALDTFDFDAGQIFRGYALGGLALSIAGTTFNVLMCLLFNLISDLTGGLRITMIEEETARPAPPRRRRRRPPSAR